MHGRFSSLWILGGGLCIYPSNLMGEGPDSSLVLTDSKVDYNRIGVASFSYGIKPRASPYVSLLGGGLSVTFLPTPRLTLFAVKRSSFVGNALNWPPSWPAENVSAGIMYLYPFGTALYACGRQTGRIDVSSFYANHPAPNWAIAHVNPVQSDAFCSLDSAAGETLFECVSH